MIADAIIADPGEAPLSRLLTAIHQQRLGHVCRVVSATRAPVADQLLRAGVPMTQAPDFQNTERVILVFAANLCDRGSRMLLELGALRAWTVSRSGLWTEIDDSVVVPPARPTPSRQHVLSLPEIEIGVQQ